MASLAKLAIISEMEGEALLKNCLHISSCLEKQSYLMSTRSYQLSVKSILLLMCIQYILKSHVSQMEDSYRAHS